jgi:hypothetical protein
VIGGNFTSIDSTAFHGCSGITDVFYEKSKQDWNSITIDINNATLTDATRYYYSDSKPTSEGNLWHYVDGVPTPWPAFVPPYSQGLTYKSNGDGTCSVSGIGTCTDTHIIIPSISPDGDTVTAIRDSAFYEKKSIISIKIPDTVTSIGYSAFAYCSNLDTIFIPRSVTSIAANAFSCCSAITAVYIDDIADWCGISFNNKESNPLANDRPIFEIKMYVDGTPITALVIPDGVTAINDYAFCGSYSFTSVTISNSVTSIGEQAFWGCKNIQSVVIGNGVTTIGERAFHSCTSLTSVTMGSRVTKLGSFAFYNCSSLTSIVIPDGVTSIGSYTFNDCSSIASVTIPGGVTNIYGNAFYNCSSLTRINFKGTKAQWEAIKKGYAWNMGAGKYTVYCTDGTV